MRRLLISLFVLAPAVASANGRPPASIHLHFRPGEQSEIILAATFGALFSNDDGATWRWMCETAIGYGGTYDPDYALSPTGRAFATTFDGLQVDQDACSFQLSTFGESFASQVTTAPNGNILVAMSFQGDAAAVPPIPPDFKLYRSTTDGTSFNAGVTVGTGGEWWQSLEVAPSDSNRVYLTGYRVISGQPKRLLLFRSNDGGQSYSPLAVTTFQTTNRSDLEIAAISKTDPNRLLLRVTWWQDTIGDAFYLSTNGGTSWTKVIEIGDTARGVAFRQNGEAIIGTTQSGIYRSTTGGASFTLVPGSQPNINCLAERDNGELWACTNNYAGAPFDYGVMKTTDMSTWTGVLKFEDITGPLDCPSGTIMKDCCTVHLQACPFEFTPEWCGLRAQLGITADPVGCATVDGAVGPDAPGTGGGDGCCGSAAHPVGMGVLITLVGMGLGIGRRRRRSQAL